MIAKRVIISASIASAALFPCNVAGDPAPQTEQYCGIPLQNPSCPNPVTVAGNSCRIVPRVGDASCSTQIRIYYVCYDAMQNQLNAVMGDCQPASN
jgi:hypothetical protein